MLSMNNGFYIASQILRRPWAIDPRFAQAHIHVPQMLLSGASIETDMNARKDLRVVPFLLSDSGKPFTRSYIDFSQAPENSLAVIPVIGALMKEDVEDCGMLSIGMASIGRSLIEAADNSNISAIILYIDTPGGTVDGTQALGDIIASISKPVVVFVDGLMASAGVWIGSQADYIVAENSSTQVGSIGVMISFMDQRGIMEKEGAKFHFIVPEESADKNASFLDALGGNYERIINEELRPLVLMFRDAVRKGRGKVSDSAMTGKVYFAEDALELNLIDEVGSFQKAVEKAFELSLTLKSMNSKKNRKMKSYPRLSGLFGHDAPEFQLNETSLASLSEVQLDAAEAALELLHNATGNAAESSVNEELQKQIIQLTADHAAILGGLTQTQSLLDGANARITEFQGQVESSLAIIALLEGRVQAQQSRIDELEMDPEAVVVAQHGDQGAIIDKTAGDPGAQKMYLKFQAISGAKS